MGFFSFSKGEKKTSQPELVDDFTGRVDLCTSFKKDYALFKTFMGDSEKIQPMVVSFYGEGGSGKTRLLQKLDEKLKNPMKKTRDGEEIIDFSDMVGEDPRTVFWSFKDGCDEVSFLLGLKNRLLAQSYGFNFPLFELGYYFYKVKVGEKMEDPRNRQSILDGNPTLGLVFNAANEIPVVSQFSKLISLADKCVTHLMEMRDKRKENVLDITRKIDEAGVEIQTCLRDLFVADMVRNVKDLKSPLIIFLDSYEQFVNEFGEDLQKDLWLRSSSPVNKGLVYSLPKVMWVIASRTSLKWSELDESWPQKSMNLYQLKPFSAEESGKYIARVTDMAQSEAHRSLIDGLYQLTKGVPFSLKSYCDMYNLLHEQVSERVISLEDLSQDGDRLVENFVKQFPLSMRQILYMLAWLQQWTESLIDSVGNKVLPNFNQRNYVEIMKLSLITETDDGFVMDANLRESICRSIAKQNYSDNVLEKLYDIIVAQGESLNLSKSYCLDFRLRALPQIIENKKRLYAENSMTVIEKRLEYVEVLRTLRMYREAYPLAEGLMNDLMKDKCPTQKILDAINKVDVLLDGLYEGVGDSPKIPELNKMLLEYYGNLLKGLNSPVLFQDDGRILIMERMHLCCTCLDYEERAQEVADKIAREYKRKLTGYGQLKQFETLEYIEAYMNFSRWYRKAGKKVSLGKVALKYAKSFYQKCETNLGLCHTKTLDAFRMLINVKANCGVDSEELDLVEDFHLLLGKYSLVYGENSDEVKDLLKEMEEVCNEKGLVWNDPEISALIFKMYQKEQVSWPEAFADRLVKMKEFLKKYLHFVDCEDAKAFFRRELDLLEKGLKKSSCSGDLSDAEMHLLDAEMSSSVFDLEERYDTLVECIEMNKKSGNPLGVLLFDELAKTVKEMEKALAAGDDCFDEYDEYEEKINNLMQSLFDIPRLSQYEGEFAWDIDDYVDKNLLLMGLLLKRKFIEPAFHVVKDCILVKIKQGGQFDRKLQGAIERLVRSDLPLNEVKYLLNVFVNAPKILDVDIFSEMIQKCLEYNLVDCAEVLRKDLFGRITVDSFERTYSGFEKVLDLPKYYEKAGVAIDFENEFCCKLKSVYEESFSKNLSADRRADLCRGICRCLEKLKKYDSMLEMQQRMYECFVKLYPENHDEAVKLRMETVKTLCLMGRYQEALEEQEKLLQYSYDYLKYVDKLFFSDCVDCLVSIYAKLNLSDKIVDVFVDSLHKFADGCSSYNSREIVKLAGTATNLEKLKTFLERAVEDKDLQDVDDILGLALLYLNLGEDENALALLEKCYEDRKKKDWYWNDCSFDELGCFAQVYSMLISIYIKKNEFDKCNQLLNDEKDAVVSSFEKDHISCAKNDNPTFDVDSRGMTESQTFLLVNGKNEKSSSNIACQIVEYDLKIGNADVARKFINKILEIEYEPCVADYLRKKLLSICQEYGRMDLIEDLSV